MAGATTAERGADEDLDPGPPSRRRLPGPRALIAAAVALVLIAGASVWTLYGSSWLRAGRVSVSGTRVLTEAQVREAADVPLGDPLISVDLDGIEARLLAKLPRIDSVEVVRSWPDGIGLKVSERTAVLIVEAAGNSGNYVEVDAKGVRFATVSRAPEGVPVLELATPRSGSSAASLRRFGEDRLVREAVRVAGAIPAAIAHETLVVKVRSYDAISLELSGDRTVAWGSAEKGRAKARALTALMKAAPGEGHFDVSVPTAPASSGS
ncbi:cell division protein FtsQ/DivIB [Streptomyces griseiscabiei]|uniref:Cell division protein FtsQ n=1 Tax=Streptomyces griseiscabiei TaxID=2993540 RepID=A0ABU4KVP7_9ACTN|nr:FtsQ-type POTRA domain-containing protein [Streptomyces griseiscabiei]MBZ3903134.1 FtsQ-type POTRA domain-containing protein [Streptomyces griseiscabiei]MDX2907446.1 FtsQ-type POTRA domain-containing protein [Streptomyces griseiscabiei]